MISLLLKLIGAPDAFRADVQNVSLEWARPVMLGFGLALLVPVGVYIVLRHRRNLPHVNPPTRRVLNGCRIGVLLLLVLVIAGPYMRVEQTVQRKAVLAVVLDDSASMTLPAGPFDAATATTVAKAAGLDESAAQESQAEANGDADTDASSLRGKLDKMSRLELAEQILSHRYEALIAPLAQRFDIRTYRVARTVRRADLQSTDPAAASDLSAHDASGTALGTLLKQVIDDAAANGPAGVLLFSDGRSTSGPDPMRILRERAGSAGRTALLPIWAVPIGSSVPLKDISLVDVFTPAQVSVKDTAAIVVTVASQGLPERQVKVRLKRDDQTLQEKTVTLRDERSQRVELTYQTDRPGTDLLTVEVDEEPEETVLQNNRQPVQVLVDRSRLKLLYIEGAPRWDFRFLDHSLRRDHGLEVTSVLEDRSRADTSQDPARAVRLPQDAEGFASYDAILLGDVSPALLGRRTQEQLCKAVQEKGTGLLVQAGILHMPQAYRGGPLAKILPVWFATGNQRTRLAPGDTTARSSDRAPLAGAIEAPAHLPFSMTVTKEGAIHPAMRLYDSATRNRRIWNQMPHFYWACAGGSAPRGGAEVLAEIETVQGRRPLIAEHFAGRGRVMFVGTDSTFRWRQNIGSYVFYRFWGQAIRHVAHQGRRSGEQSWIEVRPARAEPDETISVQLYAVNREGQPLEDPAVELQVTWEDSIDTLILRRGQQDGHFRATWQPSHLGEYHMGYTDARGRAVNAAVRVASSGQELRQPIVDRAALRALADRSGGAMIEAAELDSLPERLQGEPIVQRQVHEHEVWDNWITLVLLIGLYCTDVGVRRLLGLT